MRSDRKVRGARLSAALAIVAATSFTLIGSSTLGAVAAPVAHRVSARPAWAVPQNLSRRVAPNKIVNFDVLLGWNDPAAVAALAKSVSDPASASYGKYLSPAAFMARFSPSASAVDAVNAWLRSQGLTPGTAPASRVYVPASGTAAQVERAFGTTLNVYRTGAHVMRAPSSDALIPASLSSVVQGIVGLATTRMHTSSPAAPPPGAFRVASPCSDYWGQKMATDKPMAYGHVLPYTPCGYTPKQIQGAYGLTGPINAGMDGTGQTVAIIDAYHALTIRHDLIRYSLLHGLPAPNLKQFNDTTLPGNAGDKQGWYGEETMDLEAVHTTAPGAKLIYEGTKDSFDLSFFPRYADILDNHRASIVTNSYGNLGEQGIPKSEIKATDAFFQQAVAEGIGFFFSSGDCGDEIDPQGACGGAGFRTADFSASDPYVTAVGGTSLAAGQGGSYLFETGWGTKLASLSANGNNWRPTPPGIYLYGSGGGPSHLFPQPWYQEGVVPDSMANAYGSLRRVVPDIAADGDPNTGFLVGQTQTFLQGQVRYDEYRLGGTSLSSPLMAGMMAVANQAAGHDLGFVNPLIYSLGGSDAFHDIIDPASTVAVARTNWANGVNQWNGRTYSLRTMNQTGTLHTVPGYDDVTGMGTPNGWAFLNALAGK